MRMRPRSSPQTAASSGREESRNAAAVVEAFGEERASPRGGSGGDDGAPSSASSGVVERRPSAVTETRFPEDSWNAMATHGADRTGSGRRMNAPQRHASLQKYARLESPPISSRATSVAGASRRVSSVHRKSSSHTSRHSRHTADALTMSSASSRPNIRSHNATSIATLDRTKPRARLIGLAGKPGFAGSRRSLAADERSSAFNPWTAVSRKAFRMH